MQNIGEIAFHADRFLWRFLSQLSEHMRESNLPVGAPDAKILFTISHMKEIAISQLGKQLGRDKGQITRKVKELEEKGLIARHADPKNSRVSLLTLTDSGNRLIHDLDQAVNTVMQDLLGPLDPNEREDLHRLLACVSGSRW